MKTPDCAFWINLAKCQVLNEELADLLKFIDHAGVPLDLNHPQGKPEIEAFKNFATKLEDKALEFSDIAETITVYSAMMEEILSEKENEDLPVEADPREAVGA